MNRFFILFLLLCAGLVHAQTQDTAKIFQMAEVNAEFPGGQKEMYAFIANLVEYPPEIAEQGITGRVVVSFVVGRDGGISEIKVLRRVHPKLDQAALDVVRKMPFWSPAINGGDTVRMQKIVPIHFSLQTLPPDHDSVYTVVQKMPEFPGGHKALDAYLDTAIQYPNSALVNKIQGKVVASCVINKEGKVEDVKIISEIGWGTSAEARRLLEEMPLWTPGMVDGNPVKVRRVFEVLFYLKRENLVSDRFRIIAYDGPIDNNAIPKDDVKRGAKIIRPAFPGGQVALTDHMVRHMRIPESEYEWRNYGGVVARFTIDENGAVQDVVIDKSNNPGLNSMVLSALENLPDFKPGTIDGKPAVFYFYLPVNFED